jgi:molybdopterin molybdotransferase
MVRGQIAIQRRHTHGARARAEGEARGRRRACTTTTTRLRAVLDAALRNADVVVTSGGVSMGAYDTVKSLLSASGEVEFVKVAQHPGMPQGAGRLGPQRVPIVTLPGNPVSSFISFELYVRPLIRRLMGKSDLVRPRTARVHGRVRLPARQAAVRPRVLDVHGRSHCGRSAARGPMSSAGSRWPTRIVVPPDVPRVGGDVVTVLDQRSQS